jgi:uracil-DNA glycosylase family protein
MRLEMARAAEPVRSAAAFLPPNRTLAALADASRTCRGCDLYLEATQTVFGEGPARAEIMMIGEQPGDREDREGHPFVGPAGRLLDHAMQVAGIDRTSVYVTNAVKHFKFEPRGKRRIHKKPNAEEIRACRPWLETELEAVGPKVVVCLDATAARAVIGRSFRVTRHRGEFVDTTLDALVTATVHPSSILRSPDDSTRAAETDALVRDLRSVADVLRRGVT